MGLFDFFRRDTSEVTPVSQTRTNLTTLGFDMSRTMLLQPGELALDSSPEVTTAEVTAVTNQRPVPIEEPLLEDIEPLTPHIACPGADRPTINKLLISVAIDADLSEDMAVRYAGLAEASQCEPCRHKFLLVVEALHFNTEMLRSKSKPKKVLELATKRAHSLRALGYGNI